MSQLPSWARKKVIERPSIVKSISTGSLVEKATEGGVRNHLPEGRWAQVGVVERWWDESGCGGAMMG